jgi:Translin family
MVGLLNRIHVTPSEARRFPIPCCSNGRLNRDYHWLLIVPSLLDTVRPVLQSCQSVMEGLATLVPPTQFWRWKDMWSNSMKTAVFAAVLTEYLTTRKLLTLAEVATQLGSKLHILSGLMAIRLTDASSQG